MAEPVMCLGECLVDRLFQLSEERPSPFKNWTDYPGGAPANVAAAIAKLGTPSQLVGCLGQDDLGSWLIQALEQQGVRCYMARHAEAPTRTVLVQRDASGERHFIGFSAPDPTRFADAHLSPDWVDSLDFTGVDYLVMGTLGLAYGETATAMKRAQERAQQHGTKLVVDLNWRPVFWPQPETALATIRPFLSAVDVLKLSREEALWLAGTDCAADICQQLGCQAVLLTDGAHGSTWATAQKSVAMSAFTVDSEDTTGAGDASLAAVIHQLHCRGEDCLQQPEVMQDILRYASAVGALTTLRPGAISAQPTPQEVDAFLYLHPRT